jgi:N-acetyl sugar amidotransferase
LSKSDSVTYCTFCVMNSSNLQIEFNADGRCNFCLNAEQRIFVEKNEIKLKELISTISEQSANKYDCVIGLSGGLDSSYVAYLLTKVYGLKPLAIHLDNGWNSEVAVANIRNITQKLHIDLVTYVIDWDEFLDIQRSFFLSGLKNCEIPTDHAILAVLYKEAKKNNIKYIVHGGNVATESIMPDEWMEDCRDFRLLKNVIKKYGSTKLETFPQIKLRTLAKHILIDKIKFVGILNYIDYKKEVALEILAEEIDYRKIEVKHGESTFTRFFQEEYLPKRFGIDKRYAHFSSEIVSKNISRQEAINKLEVKMDENPAYAYEFDFILDKLEFTKDAWDELLSQSGQSYMNLPHTPFLHENRTGPIQFLRRIATNR